tara:strand:- start:51 stop:2327 length:2277 start_codon:yes stop_codon:yes gene_type:complete
MSANNNIKENVWAMQNELRNKEGITGIDAMHHVLMILLAKSFTIEQCQKLNISGEFAFENLIKLNKSDLFSKFYNPSNMRNTVIHHIRRGDTFGYNKDSPFQIKNESTLEFMFHRVNNISTEELMNTNDVIGDIYEHFINREGKTMKDLGQYFTDRVLIGYLVNLCNPQADDGKVPTVWDPSAGTGGFIIEYIKRLNESNPDIDWSLNKNNLFANDINKNTYSLLKQNLYYSLKEGAGITIKLADSLVNDDDQMYDFILANPPFGIKGLKYKDMCEKVKNLGINGTKGEILFLQLCMAKLNDNGKCVIVVPEGVLFNCTKMYKETRKYLLENFNLKRVIKVGEGEFFKNTGVKTSVLFFEKSGQTENIEFIQVDKINDTIEEVPLMTVEMEKIIENDYSLNMNLYKEITYITNESYDIKKLSEITHDKKGQSIKVKGENLSGDYPIVSGGTNICGYYHKYNREGNTILISSSGQAGYVSRYPSKLWASDCWSIHSNDENYLTNNYLYHVLKFLQETIYEYQTGSVIKHIAFKDIKNLKIPVPPIDVQNRIVEQLDNIYETEIESSKEVIKSLKFSIETIMKNTMYRDDLVEYKIKDIINTTRGNLCKPSEKAEENIYPYYAGDKISGYVNTYEFSGPSIMMNYRLSLGSKRPCQYIRDGDYNCSRFSWVCTLNSDNILSYIYHYFNNIINYDDLLVGSTILEINQKNLGNYKIRIPPSEIQREILRKIEPKERLINQLEKNINRAEKEAKEIMDVLFK